ncbi:MAG: biotin/lipoate A/B protein ligase family protein, partial [Planctomycetaceae bacterium]
GKACALPIATQTTGVRNWMACEPVLLFVSSTLPNAEVDADACRAAGVAVLRRPSGGLSVVLGPGCLMWTVVAAWPEPTPTIGAIHDAILDPLCAALQAAGRDVVRSGSSDLAIRSRGSLRKISGNALRVSRGVVLYHGTLLDAFDLDLVGRVLRHPPREPDYRAGRPHADFLENLALGRGALEHAVRRAFVAEARRGDWPRDDVERLLRDRYLTPAWTERLQ